MSEPIVRIAARGDGVTPSGRHVAFAVPGDLVTEDGVVHPGPGHQKPPCRHFPQCGGCQLQHLTDDAYADYCQSRIGGALAQHGLETDVRPALLSPPRARRRASLRALKAGGKVLIGFNAGSSNQIVDMRECHVLRPELFALLDPLRVLLAAMLPARRTGEVHLTLADQGVDLMLKSVSVEGLDAIEALTAFCDANSLARLSIDEGYGAEPRFEPRPVTITLGATAVALPIGAFLQATREGEGALAQSVIEAVGDPIRPLDLFAGLGTFALNLPGRVMAAEASRDAVLSLKRAAPQIDAQHRDLYRRPFDEAELAEFDAVVLDPPRAGAEEQVKALAGSAVPRIAYVSCNPATFARDSRILADGGYRLSWVQPVGQFLWSTHVELAACFTRESGSGSGAIG
ncbi:class I SAM-dependent RNA methyltransferase [Sphingomonas sp. HDW15A]|uniref:class I SAM-dependent RNA methyltransferase n=1 Tax=Sphingomonas sp. HDW15A TaxID=2714942 RepID=UPI001F0E4EEB|nr:class I SAM-dependent RNA methyltransferase [Sphingomonas sp. HDW15A]